MQETELEEQVDQSTAKFMYIAEKLFAILKLIITWGGICLCFYFAMKAVQSFAGKTTSNSFFFSLFTDLKINQWFGFAVGGGGVIYGQHYRHREKKLKNNYNKSLTELKGKYKELKEQIFKLEEQK